LIQRLE